MTNTVMVHQMWTACNDKYSEDTVDVWTVCNDKYSEGMSDVTCL